MEQHIVDYLTSQPIVDEQGNPTGLMEYRELPASEYNKPDNKEHCLLIDELIAFLKDTQPKEYAELVAAKDGDEAAARRSIVDRIESEMRSATHAATAASVLNNALIPQGTLSLLRAEEFDAGYGVKFKLLYNRPSNDKTPELVEWYRKNRLVVVRQLRYSKVNANEIDLVIFVNGFPIITIELKNAMTNQTHHEAIKQYMRKRDPKGEKFLEFKRCLVHFAVGTEQVYMTTRLAGEDTRFFPFNMKCNNVGVKSDNDGYRTSYLWEDVLRRDSVLDLLLNYLTVQVSTEKEYNPRKKAFDDKVSEALIFPRYHQRRAVSRLLANVRERGVGHNYLVQHSAGSGKSNTITWLAFRLSNMFRYMSDDKPMFDSIIVVTDRRVLNDQLQRNLRQFSTVEGELFAIGQNKNAEGHQSTDLKNAIEQRKRIIVTTIQMFPHIADNISLFPDRRYAVIIDEAHSSQSGENARQMRKALSLDEAAAIDLKAELAGDNEDKIREAIDKYLEADAKRKGNKANVSFFAFTATPKDKTVELFCDREYGSKDPFDSYTMEEAIKEEFILDVMQNYMSFKRYYKLVRDEKFEDKEYDKRKTVRLLSSYVDLQDAAIERKSRIMIEHFATQTAKEIGGRARAMLVTRSRLHAVRYKLKFDSIMQEMHLPYRALVAFSGTVKDEETGLEYTETSMNNLQGQISIPDALKMTQYRILIVANKFQTGFDEPLLHTMFVDKKLGGTSTVQTLSRLNRTKRGKDSTMVLDFVNDPDDMLADFQKYYGKNRMDEQDETDPNSLYDVKTKLRDFNVFTMDDVNKFMRYFVEDGKEQQKINIVLDEVSDRAIKTLDGENLDKFRKTCRSFNRLYTFLSQIITFTDVDLEKLSLFCLALSKKLPYKKESLPYDVLTESQLDSYRIQYISTRNLELQSGDAQMKGMKPGESKPAPDPDFDWLSNIIKVLNETFGIDLTDDDKVDLKRLKERVMSNEQLLQYFTPLNSRDDVRSKFDEEVDAELLSFITTKLDLYNKLTEDRVNTLFKSTWFNELYDQRVRALR